MRNSGTTSKKGYFRAWLTTFWSYDFHSSSTKSAHIRFQAFHICFVLEAGHPSYGTIIQSDEISLHWLASDDTRCAFFLEMVTEPRIFMGFSPTTTLICIAQKAHYVGFLNYTGFSCIVATAKLWAAPIDVFLLHRQGWDFNVSQDRRMFHILLSDGRVSFFGILVSNFQHRREKSFLGLPLQGKQFFFPHYFSCDVLFWKVIAWADLTLWHAFATKYRLRYQQHLQP